LENTNGKNKTKIYTGKEAPVPVLCNRAYEKDIEKIKRFRGFGGKRKIILKPKILAYWFNQGAYLVNIYDQEKDGDQVDYAFNILRTMQRPKSEQWSIIYDLKTSRIYFRSFFGSNIRYIDMSSFNFNTEQVDVLPDMHINYAGDVSKYFVPYANELNNTIVEKSLSEFLVAFKKLYTFENTDSSPEKYIEKRKSIVLKILMEE